MPNIPPFIRRINPPIKEIKNKNKMEKKNKKNKKNKMVIRKDLEHGKFTTVHHSIINDKRLTDIAFRILVSILSDSDDKFGLSQGLLISRFNCDKKTIRKALKCLEDCGYMKREQQPRGHFYIISEFGNLNKKDESSLSNSEKSSEEGYFEKMESYIHQRNKLFESNDSFIELFKSMITEHPETIDGFYSLKNEFEKVINYIKDELFISQMEPTKNLSKHYSKDAIKDYSEWLKVEIYEKENFNVDGTKVWPDIKQKHYNFKTDYETMMYDKAEQDYYDNL